MVKLSYMLRPYLKKQREGTTKMQEIPGFLEQILSILIISAIKKIASRGD